jgi:putrescine aminotransferase
MMTAQSGQRDVMRGATAHMTPGIAQIQRILGRGAYEASALGAEVTLSDGRTLIDFGSYAVTLFGHRPPSVVAAVQDALDNIPAATRLLPNPYSSLLAQRMTGMRAPERLSRVVFGINGADVVEAAMKLAIAQTGHASILAVEGAFHGKSLGALAVTADPERRKPVQNFLGNVRHLPLREDAVNQAAREAPFAALIFEPIQGEGGGRLLPPELLRRWYSDAHAAGAYVISDEIQVGLRRCGPVSLSIELGLVPDALLLGKALGGGVMPLSALLCTPELFGPLQRDPFFHTATFGGHPLCCAAGLAALDLLDEIPAQAGRTSKLLTNAIRTVAAAHPEMILRSSVTGLFGVLDFGSPTAASMVLFECARLGLLLCPCLSAPSVLRVLPPANAPETLIESAEVRLDMACTAAARRITG